MLERVTTDASERREQLRIVASRIERESGAMLRHAKDAGIIVGSGLVPAGAAVVMVGTSGVIIASSTTIAVAAGAVLLVPVAMTIATVRVIQRHQLARVDNSRIEQRLTDRGAHLPLNLVSGAQVQRSAFFPSRPRRPESACIMFSPARPTSCGCRCRRLRRCIGKRQQPSRKARPLKRETADEVFVSRVDCHESRRLHHAATE